MLRLLVLPAKNGVEQSVKFFLLYMQKIVDIAKPIV